MISRSRFLRWALAIMVLLALTPIPIVSKLEEQDAFCASCHTAPEVTYVQRARLALAGEEPILDLASEHYVVAEGFRCINCHRGNMGLVHRATTLSLGFRDTLIFVSGRADETIEKTEIEAPELLTAGCVNCHADTLLVAGFENHFHNKLPEAYALWQAGGRVRAPGGTSTGGSETRLNTSVRCLNCHLAHIYTPGAELTGFLDLENVTFPACVRCHQEVGRGPLELVAP